MKKQLIFEAILKFLLGFVLLFLFVFVPVGALNFFGGWLLIAVLFVPMLIMGIVLVILRPELLLKRLNYREPIKSQSKLVKLSAVAFVLGFVVAGLDFRFTWTDFPLSCSVVSAIVFLIFYFLYAVVLWQNPFLSRTIEIQKNQNVVDSGMYSIVRHPMYSVTVVMFLLMPLILGSAYAFVIFLSYPFIIVGRILDEEAFLQENLSGYSEYMKKVKYRLIPYIW